MTNNELTQILYALITIFGTKKGEQLFKKILDSIIL